MLADRDVKALRACLRAMNKAWGAAPGGHRFDAVHEAYETAFHQIETVVRDLLAADTDRRAAQPATRKIRAATAATRRRGAVLAMVAAKPRSVREILPALRRKGCSCTPSLLGRELRGMAREGLIAREASGRRGGKLWCAVAN